MAANNGATALGNTTSASGSSTTNDPQARGPPVSAPITPSAGGTVTDGNATLTFAPGAVADNTVVTITPTATSAPGLQIASAGSYQLSAVDSVAGQTIDHFAVPPQLTLRYTPGAGSAPTIYYLPTSGVPEALSTTANAVAGTVTADLPHFSLYAAAVPVSSLSFGVPLVEVTVTGTVTGPGITPSPLPGVDVLATQPANGFQVLTTTDTNGNFSLGLNRNQWTLQIGRYDPTTGSITDLPSYQWSQQSVDTTNNAVGSTVNLGSIALPSYPTTVSGLTQDSMGTAIPNVQIYATFYDSSGNNYLGQSQTVSGNDGSFTLTGPLGSWYLQGTDVPNYYPASAETAYATGTNHSFSSISVTGNLTQNLTYAQMPREVTGSAVTDAVPAAGIPGVVFSYYWSSADNGTSYVSGYGQGTTDASGNYTFYVPADVNYLQVSNYSQVPGYVRTSNAYQYPSTTGTGAITASNFVYHQLVTPVSGFVLDDTGTPGAPVAGVTVEGYGTGTSGGSFDATATTDAHGAYTLMGDTGSWTIYTYGAPYGYADDPNGHTLTVPQGGVSCALVDSSGCDLTDHKYLTPVSGFVLDDTGSPGAAVAGVTVSAYWYDANFNYHSTSTITGNDGSYTLLGDPGSWTISVSDYGLTGYGAAPASKTITIPEADPACTSLDTTGCINFVWHKFATAVSGYVLDDTGAPGAPISGAEVSAYWYDANYSYHTVSTITGNDGSYTLLGDPGSWTIQVYDYGLTGYGSRPSSQTITVPEADPACTSLDTSGCVDFIWHKYSTFVSGRVTDSSSTPVPLSGVTVFGSWTDASGNSGSQTVATDLNGDYTLLGDPGTWTVRIQTAVTGYTTPATKSPTVSAAGLPCTDTTSRTDCVDFKYVPDGIVTGLVTYSSGSPVPNASLQACDQNNTSSCASATANAAGEYQMFVPIDSSAGSPQVWIRGANLSGYDTPSFANLSVASGQVVTQNLVYSPFSTTYSGTTQDSFGNPVPHAWVYVTDALGDQVQVQSDGTGNWSVTGPYGAYNPAGAIVTLSSSTPNSQLYASPSPQSLSGIAQGSVNTGLSIVFPDALITGTLTDTTTGQGVPGATLQEQTCNYAGSYYAYYYCQSYYSWAWSTINTIIPEADGSYSFTVAPGTAPILLVPGSATGYNPPSPMSLILSTRAGGQTYAGNDFTYSPQGQTVVTGYVVDDTGAPISGVTVALDPGGNYGGPVMTATTDPTGYYTFDIINPAASTYSVEPEGFPGQTVNGVHTGGYTKLVPSGNPTADQTAGLYQTFAAVAGTPVALPNLVMNRDGTIIGTVLDDAGNPVVGASVYVNVPNSPWANCVGPQASNCTSYPASYNAGGATTYTAITDVNGVYHLEAPASSAVSGPVSIVFNQPQTPAAAPGQGGWDSGYSVDGTVTLAATGSVLWYWPYSWACPSNPGGLACPVGPNGTYSVGDPTQASIPAPGGQGYPLPGEPQYGLIARLGNGTWQFVGDGPTQISGSGELFFAVNDNLFNDNSGSWTITLGQSGTAAYDVTTGPSLVVKPKLLWGTGPTGAYYTTPGDAQAVPAPLPGGSVEVDFAPTNPTATSGPEVAPSSGPYLRAATVSGVLGTDTGSLPAGVEVFYSSVPDSFYYGSDHAADHLYQDIVVLPAGATTYSIPVPAGSSGADLYTGYTTTTDPTTGALVAIYGTQNTPVAGYGFSSPAYYYFSSLSPGAPYSTGYDFSWVSMGTVSGTVYVYDGHGNRVFPVDSSGTPIPITVQNSSSESTGGSYTYTTTADPVTGAYTLPALAGTSYVRVVAELPGYGYAGPPNSTNDTLTETVPASGSNTGVDFEYLAWVNLKGQLSASDNALPASPAPSASVYALDQWGHGYYFTVSGLGSFTQSVPVGQTTVTPQQSYTGYQTPAYALLSVPSAGLSGVNLEWIAEGTVSGHLQGPNGENVGTPTCSYYYYYYPWCYSSVALAPATVQPNTVISTWVYLDPASPPQEVMLQFHDSTGSWEHRAYWGQNLMQFGNELPGPAQHSEGALVATGMWIQLTVSAADLGLVGDSIDGVSYTLYGGQAWWDGTTMSSPGGPTTVLLGNSTPAAPATLGSDHESWIWSAPPAPAPDGSALVSWSPAYPYEHQHNFTGLGDYTTPADSSGNYSISVLAGGYTVTPPTVNPYATPGPDSAVVTAGLTATANFLYSTGGTITGTVLANDVSSTALSGVKVCDELGNCGTTGSGGVYSFHTALGAHTIYPGYLLGFGVPATQPVTVVNGGETDTINFVYPVDQTVSGVITDDVTPAPDPLSGATVSFRYYDPNTGQFLGTYTSAPSGSDGSYSLTMPVGTNEQLVPSALAGYQAPASQSVSAPQSGVNFVYLRDGSLTVSAVDNNGTPIQGLSVTTAYGPTQTSTGTTDVMGSYTFSALEPGSYWVYVNAPSHYAQAPGQWITVPSGQNAPATFSFVPDALLSGVVQDDTGAGLVGVSVCMSGTDSLCATTGSGGAFQAYLSPGTYSVTPQSFTGSWGNYLTPAGLSNVALSPGQTDPLAAPFTYVRESVIGVQALSVGGTPLRGVLITATQNGNTMSAYTAPSSSSLFPNLDGLVTFAVLANSPVTLQVTSSITGYDLPLSPADTETVTATAGHVLVPAFNLPVWGTVQGTVLDQSGKSILIGGTPGSVHVYLTDSNGNVIGAADTNAVTGGYTIAARRGPANVNVNPVTGYLSPTPYSANLVSATATTVNLTMFSAPSTPQLVTTDDSGVSQQDGITKVTMPHFSVTTGPNLVVQLVSGGSIIGSATADPTGKATVQVASPLADGVYLIAAQAVSNGVTSGLSNPTSITIDTTPPPVPSEPQLTPGEDTGASSLDNVTDIRTLSFNVSEAEAGASMTILLGGVTPYSGALGDGSYTFTAIATDVAGNNSSPSPALTVVVDGTPPTATVTVPPADSWGWYDAPVTVSYTPSDALSGIDVAASDLLSFQFTGEGAAQSHTFTFFDRAGNENTISVSGINIDLTKPTATVTVPPADSWGWYDAPVTVSYAPVDALSGVDGAKSDPLSFVFSSEGAAQSHTFNFVDKAGNTNSVTVSGINIDLTKPTATTTVPAANSWGWYGAPVTVSYAPSDALSGVDGAKSDPLSFVFSSEGSNQSHTFSFVDKAGNTNSVTVSGINIDLTKPTATTTVPAANANGWYDAPVTVSYTPSDALSGVDGAKSDLLTFQFTGEGSNQSHTFNFVDKAGNTNTISVSGINIDLTKPTATTTVPAANANGWYDAPVTVSYAATDVLSGVDGAKSDAVSFVFSSEGSNQSHTFNFMDKAGNTNSVTVSGINIDLTKPTATVTVPPADSWGWYDAPVTVSYAATDALSGVDAAKSDLLSFQFTGEGAAQSHTFNFVDKAGNTNSVTVSGINIDLTKPTATVTVPPADSWGWYDAPVTVSYAPVDALSGVDGAKSDPLSFVFSSEGAAQSHTFNFVDKAGNTNSVTVSGINIDLTKPTATTTVPAANANGWYDAPVTVSYTPSDALSGVDAAKSDLLSFQFTGEGAAQSHTFNFVDKAGNTNSVTVSGINIDLTKPTATTTVPAANGNGWYDAPVTVSYTPSDALSGVDAAKSDLLTFQFTGEGSNQSHTFNFVDKAGNTNSVSVSGINIDLTKPTATTTVPAANGNGWYDAPVTVSYAATDVLSGVDGAKSDAVSFVFSSEGAAQSHTFNFVDKAGNTNSVTVSGINIDLTKPTATTTVPAANANGWYDAPVTVSYAPTDALSGVDAAKSDLLSFVFSSEGAAQSHTFNFVDKAGNTNSVTVSGINIDLTKPTATTTVPAANANGWYDAPVTVSYAPTDALSGVDAAKSDLLSFVFSSEGSNQSHTFNFVDKAGNTNSVTVSGVNIDLTKPTATVTVPPADSWGWYDAPVTVSYAPTDALSGVDAAKSDLLSFQFTGEGAAQSHTFNFVDKAGNTNTISVSGVNIDLTKPTATVTVPPADSWGWYDAPVTVSYAPTDALSGVDAAKSDPLSFVFSSEGSNQSHTFNFVDKAGNTNTVTVSGINIDLTKPTATVTVPPADSWGWYDAPVTVSYAPVDVLSGVDGAKSDLLSFVFSSEGSNQSHTFNFVDKAGNTNTISVSGVNIDLTKPTATVTVPPADSWGWYDAPVTVSYAPSDALSGVDAAASDLLSFQFTGEGAAQSHTFNFVDKAGNTNTISVSGVNIDLTKPTATVTVPPADSWGWYDAPVTVSYAPTDALSGVDGAKSDPLSFVFSSEGAAQSHTFSFVDKAGNTNTVTVSGVNIDLTKPTATVTVPPADSWGWYGAPVTVSYAPSDALSGVDGAKSDPLSFVFSSEGSNQSHTFSFVDKAGNTNTISVSGVNIDLTKPTATVTVPAANANGWYDAPVTVSYAPSDALSGVDAAASDLLSFQFTGEGAAQSHTFNFVDKAGNTNTISVSGVNIDLTKPTATVTVPPADSWGWYDAPVTVSYAPTDALSGVDGAKSDPLSFVFSSEGAAQSHTFSFVDKAGNTNTISVSGINIDLTKPTATVTVPAANANGWYDAPVTVSYAPSDALSGVDGAKSDPLSFVFSSEGSNQSHTFSFVDKAGNTNTISVSGVNIDLTKPTATVTVPPRTRMVGMTRRSRFRMHRRMLCRGLMRRRAIC